LWKVVRSIAKRCDATLVAAKWQKEKLEAHGVPRVVHRPFGIEKKTFRPDARSFEARRDLLALAGRDTRDDGTMIAIGIGRFAVEKRWDVVIDAFLRVRERERRDAVLVLYGDGPERARMTARAKESPDVVFPGFVKDRDTLARAFASADVLVHGCPYETFGLSVAEAMACGLPAVLPDQGGAYEMFDPDSAETYASGDVDACAAAMVRLFDRIERDGPALRAFAASAGARLPDVREQFERQVGIYEELLATKRARPA
jgi:alpha-1,6-mannosyltransferase